MPKPVAALLAAAAAALTLAACGGGGSSSNEASGTTAQSAANGKTGSSKAGKPSAQGEGTAQTKGTRSERSKGPSSGGGSGGGASVAPLKVSGGGSAQLRTKGGDNSIQNFGEEDESELREAAEALHAFYAARAEEDWGAACSYLTASTVSQFEALAQRTPQLKGKGCAAVLNAFTRPLPPSVERETTEVDAVSLRREGERAFLIYRGAEGKAYAIVMAQEGGRWKVGSLAGTPLS